MSFFSNLLSDALDMMFAPSCALDSHSSGHDSTLSSISSDSCGSTFNSDSGADWHNSWGTQADYQSPAESGNMFSSNDWSSGCGGSTFGNDWP